MKIIKNILLVSVIFIFTSGFYNSAKARDCSNPEGFHQKMMCKLSGVSIGSSSGETKKKVKKTKKEPKEPKKKITLVDVFKKIKD